MTGEQHKVCIVYPADPVGVIPGGIDTFIRGILRWAPEDVEVDLVGVSTDTCARPLGRWTECDLGRRSYRFFPVAALNNPQSRGRVPLSVLFVMGLLRYRPRIDAQVLEFHRIEPLLIYLRDRRPKTAFVHQNMQVLRNPDSDILWSKLPGFYFWLEELLMRRLSSIYSVREDAVAAYRERLPAQADTIRFVPTWMDPDVFFPLAEDKVQRTRGDVREEFALESDCELLMTVGRMDSQKDPLLLARAFEQLLKERRDARLLYVGDGVLRQELEEYLHTAGLAQKVVLAGLRSASEIARLLQAADLFVLTSAYEGMPMCVLEALGTGLPVVSTRVGEVERVVHTGLNGEVVRERTADAIASACLRVLGARVQYAGEPCVLAVSDYTPEKVLAPVYDNYRRLAAEFGSCLTDSM